MKKTILGLGLIVANSLLAVTKTLSLGGWTSLENEELAVWKQTCNGEAIVKFNYALSVSKDGSYSYGYEGGWLHYNVYIDGEPANVYCSVEQKSGPVITQDDGRYGDFYLDGYNGNSAWYAGRVRVYVPAGSHTIEWRLVYNYLNNSTLSVQIKDYEREAITTSSIDIGNWIGLLCNYGIWRPNTLSVMEQNARNSASDRDKLEHALIVLIKAAEDPYIATAIKSFGVNFDYQDGITGKPTFSNPKKGNDMVDKALSLSKGAIESAISDLSSIKSDVYLSEKETPLDEGISVDSVDRKFLQAFLKAILSMAYYTKAYNATFDYSKLADLYNSNKKISPSEIFKSQSGLFDKVRDASALSSAKTLMKEALTLMQSADRAVSSRPYGAHLFNYDKEFTEQITQARSVVNNALLALDETHNYDYKTVINEDFGLDSPLAVNLSVLYSGKVSRAQFPKFTTSGEVDIRNVPDPTFAGVLPKMTSAKWTKFMNTIYPTTYDIVYALNDYGWTRKEEYKRDQVNTLPKDLYSDEGRPLRGWVNQNNNKFYEPGILFYNLGEAKETVIMKAIWK